MNHGAALLECAGRFLGIHEVLGQRSNPVILKWIQDAIPWQDLWDDSTTAWCGCFMAAMFRCLGLTVPPAPYRAASWAAVGTPVALKDAQPGDVVVRSRAGGNHVQIFVRWTSASKQYYCGRGGNQSDSVKDSQFTTDGVFAVRRV